MDALEQAEELHIDLDALMRIIVRTTEVQNSDELLKLIDTDVTEIFRDDAANTDSSSETDTTHRDYHRGYLNPLSTKREKSGTSPAPITFQVGCDDHTHSSAWINTFQMYGLRDTAEHSTLDLERMFGNHFIFSNIPGKAGKRETFLLKLLTPYLHFALMRTRQAEKKSSDHPAEPADTR